MELDPLNSYAQAYYGYILKVYDNELEKGVNWMKKALRIGLEFENLKDEESEEILDAK